MNRDEIAQAIGISVDPCILDHGDEPELADRTIDLLGGLDCLATDADRLYRYDDSLGTWGEVRAEDVRRLIFQRFERASVRSGVDKQGQTTYKPLTLSARKAGGTLRVLLDKVEMRDFLGVALRLADRSPGVLFADGYLQLGEGLRKPERTDYALEATRLPIRYDPGARCPEWRAMLRRCWPAPTIDLDDYQCRERLLQEFFGAALFGLATRHQRVLLLVGEGGNGKSVVVRILERLFPEAACTSVPIQRMSDPYYAELLLHSRVNIVGELPARDVFETADFKGIVDGGLVVARRIREAPVAFHPVAAHVFSSNSLPQASDPTDGFWRRFMALDFPRRFRPEDEDYNPSILADLEAELPGIATWAVAGAERLHAEGDYTWTDASDRVIEEWRRESNTVALFVHETLTIDPEGEYPAADLYRDYRDWCADSGCKPFSAVNFGKRARALSITSRRVARGIVYGLRGKPRELRDTDSSFEW